MSDVGLLLLMLGGGLLVSIVLGGISAHYVSKANREFHEAVWKSYSDEIELKRKIFFA